MTTVYDEIPYANLPFAQARPSVFATVAALHGLTPPDPRRARVLELGCGAGANLAGIAAANPEATAVGVDLAASAIAEGRETAAAAGLDNLRFEVGDVLALTAGELGEFDYVIAHGLYSWVDAPAREATLAACRSHLSADGIAYVSYTAHPGGHLRRMLREAAEWHARGLDDLVERAQLLGRPVAHAGAFGGHREHALADVGMRVAEAGRSSIGNFEVSSSRGSKKLPIPCISRLATNAFQ